MGYKRTIYDLTPAEKLAKENATKRRRLNADDGDEKDGEMRF
jgi:hypothetical protein